jgi:hypothetical protein
MGVPLLYPDNEKLWASVLVIKKPKNYFSLNLEL